RQAFKTAAKGAEEAIEVEVQTGRRAAAGGAGAARRADEAVAVGGGASPRGSGASSASSRGRVPSEPGGPAGVSGGNGGGATRGGSGGAPDDPSGFIAPSRDQTPALRGTPYHPDEVAARQAAAAVQRNGPLEAELLGFDRRIPPQRAPFNSHGQPVYFD